MMHNTHTVTAEQKIAMIRAINRCYDMDRGDRHAAITIISETDDQGVMIASLSELARLIGYKDRKSVMRATANLANRGIIQNDGQNGSKGSYRVLSVFAQSAIVVEFMSQTGRATLEADDQSSEEKKPVPENGTGPNQPVPKNHPAFSAPVPKNGTGTTKPVPKNHPGSTEPVPKNGTASRTRDARVYRNSLRELSLYNNNIPPLSPKGEKRTTAARGLTGKQNDPFGLTTDYGNVTRDAAGMLTLHNGTRQFWLERFGGDEERLDLALIQAAGYVQPNAVKPLEAQVGAQLARILAEKTDKDRRYEAAAERNARGGASRRRTPERKDEPVFDLPPGALEGEP